MKNSNSNSQATLNLAGQNPIPLVSWIGHTEGVTQVVEVIPAANAGAAFLAQNAGQTYTGQNTIQFVESDVVMNGASSSTATILSGPPNWFPVTNPAPGQEAPSYVQFQV